MHNHEPKDYECPFCVLISGKSTEHNRQEDIVYKDKDVLAYVSPKWWVNNPGNVLIVSIKHFENIYDIPDELLAKVNIITKKLALAMRNSYNCTGISTRQHNEPDGGQDVWHFHNHLYPRFKDDRLYQNHDNKRWVSSEEKQKYVVKLKNALKKLS